MFWMWFLSYFLLFFLFFSIFIFGQVRNLISIISIVANCCRFMLDFILVFFFHLTLNVGCKFMFYHVSILWNAIKSIQPKQKKKNKKISLNLIWIAKTIDHQNEWISANERQEKCSIVSNLFHFSAHWIFSPFILQLLTNFCCFVCVCVFVNALPLLFVSRRCSRDTILFSFSCLPLLVNYRYRFSSAFFTAFISSTKGNNGNKKIYVSRNNRFGYQEDAHV